ncbi:hypothetical protein ONA91_17555 [Micromonospora sp. DR5-3]|uniref:hypothetical protein n=1 Tax=unclassified Micromonospora TaxID=2617518 RepID=UPI0011D785CB|nr:MULTISPECIES: hypothetical protein [unclassified Micromonospora]MCW3816253.1 hypothetical protein [Micromonospora sp. DR5-3]TYC23932.1 hypothetical protein FXF52_12925 [Micromonospora sp. MP36]
MPLPLPGRRPSPGDGLWARRLLAAAAAAAVAAPVAAGLFRLPPVDTLAASCAIWLPAGARWLTKRWWPRRDGRLVWMPQVAGRASVEPGLVARRSLAGWADLTAETVAMAAIGSGLIGTLPDESGWAGLLRPLLAVGVAAGIGRVVYEEVRFTGRLALTATGIRHGRRTYGWTNIDLVVPHKRDGQVDGVRLRPARWVSLEPAPVVGGRDTAVPEERLVAAIEHFRSRPEMLAVGLPVTAPEPAGG